MHSPDKTHSDFDTRYDELYLTRVELDVVNWKQAYLDEEKNPEVAFYAWQETIKAHQKLVEEFGLKGSDVLQVFHALVADDNGSYDRDLIEMFIVGEMEYVRRQLQQNPHYQSQEKMKRLFKAMKKHYLSFSERLQHDILTPDRITRVQAGERKSIADILGQNDKADSQEIAQRQLRRTIIRNFHGCSSVHEFNSKEFDFGNIRTFGEVISGLEEFQTDDVISKNPLGHMVVETKWGIYEYDVVADRWEWKKDFFGGIKPDGHPLFSGIPFEPIVVEWIDQYLDPNGSKKKA